LLGIFGLGQPRRSLLNFNLEASRVLAAFPGGHPRKQPLGKEAYMDDCQKQIQEELRKSTQMPSEMSSDLKTVVPDVPFSPESKQVSPQNPIEALQS
jgi:hypothetical protein